MIIRINPSVLIDGPDHKVAVYNILKRTEEDLLRRFPNLKLFVLACILAHSGTRNTSADWGSSHTINEEETELQVSVFFHSNPGIDKIKASIQAELTTIKTMY